MLVSYRWLTELVPGLDAAPDLVADRLTTAGLEVEAMERFGEGLSDVVVVEVTKREPHPKRDKLQLVTVSDGARDQRVVCGAPNVPEPGGRVLLARAGTYLPSLGAALTAREIGGIQSEGMICSEAELGLGEDSDGILVLPKDTGELGQAIAEAVPSAQDTIYEVGVTPNRPDALGHVGVARDVAALFGGELLPPPVDDPLRMADTRIDEAIAISVEDAERCPHYGAAVAVDVRVGPSPLWLRWRLFALGVRPISNAVDITNYLLLEAGQPMHAFDLDLVRGGRIVVRRAREGERLTTLDGVERKLVGDDLVICDGEGPTALAGVMGGESSEIRSSTRRVLLECAYFEPRGIRRTSRRHGLSSESSYRFERGTDWGAPPRVLDRAADLMAKLAGAAVMPGRIHVQSPERALPHIQLRSSRLNALLGAEVPFARATNVLGRLGLTVHEVEEKDGDQVAVVEGASWRPDIEREVDLIEEVARIRGLDDLPTVLPRIQPQTPRTTGELERDAVRIAVELGLSEAVTMSFVSRAQLDAVSAPPPAVSLANPLSEDRTVMRTSLLPGLLEALVRAHRRGEQTVRLFTVGAVFLPPRVDEPSDAARASRPTTEEDRGVLPEERPSFAAVLAGSRPTHLRRPEPVDVYDAKGVAVELVERMTGRRAAVSLAKGTAGAGHLHPRGAGEVSLDGRRIGLFGPLHPDAADALGVEDETMVVELDLAALEAAGRASPRYRPIPRLPAATRDFAVVVSDDVPAGEVERVIREAAGDLCESVELFDLFRGKGIDEGHRSLAFHLVYRDPKAVSDPDHARTLTDREVDERQAHVVEVTREKLGAVLRS